MTPELSLVEARVLAALSRRPGGLYPASSVAAAAGVAEADAAAALERLAGVGLVSGEAEFVECRPSRRETVWRLRVCDAWWTVAPEVRALELPETWPPPAADRVPVRFHHLFWSGDPAAVKLPRDAGYVAEQVLRSPDVCAWGWALGALPAETLARVAAKDHTPVPLRAMIRNALEVRDGAPS